MSGAPAPVVLRMREGDERAVARVFAEAFSEKMAHLSREPEGDRADLLLAVAPSVRRRGVVTRLLEEGEGLARRLGLERISLYVAASNDGARGLYEERGSRNDGTIRSRVARRALGVDGWHRMTMDL